MSRSLLHALVVTCVLGAALGEYSLTLSSAHVKVGETVTVSVSGPCSHHDRTGCYDWISAFQYGACEGNASTSGANTCYPMGDWWWVSELQGQQLSLAMAVPGNFEFRVPYCGCWCCEPGVSEVCRCDSYDEFGISASVQVDPPIDLSGLPPVMQLAAGLLWSVTGGQSQLVSEIMETPGNCSGSCFCDLDTVEQDAAAAVRDFMALYDGFSMQGLEGSVAAVVTTLQEFLVAAKDCHLDQLTGTTIEEEIASAIAAVIPGLNEVGRLVDMAVYGVHVYEDVANMHLSWQLNNYFGAGVYCFELLKLIKSAEVYAGVAIATPRPVGLAEAIPVLARERLSRTRGLRVAPV